MTAAKDTHLNAVLLFQPHLLPELDDSAENADQDVRIHAPFVRFVDDDDRVLGKEEVCGQFTE